MSNKAKEIVIKTKKRLFGANIGNNVSIFQGNGLDFSEIKEYSIGDDVRKINWKVTAKTQKPFINVFNEERELNIVTLFAISGNIYFGSIKQKQEVMSEVLSIIAYSAIKNSDKLTSIFFSNKIEHTFKPTKSIKMLYPIVEKAITINPLGKEADYKKIEDFLLNFLKQKSIIFIIGDFFESPDLTNLAAKHEVYAIVVRDKFEEEPKFDDEIILSDPKTLKDYEVFAQKSVVDEFKKEIEKKDKKLYEHFLKNKIGFCKVYTNEEPFDKLLNLFRT